MTLSKKEFLYEISEGFKKLSENTYDSMPDEVTNADDLEYRIKSLMEMKRKYKVENLYFYKGDYDKYTCLTTHEHLQAMGIRGAAEMLITDPYDLELIIKPGSMASISFPCTGKIYYDIDSLRHDLLALELAGV